MVARTISAGTAPIVWSAVEDAFAQINANFQELYSTLEANDITVIDFRALNSSLIPSANGTYDIGNASHRWKDMYVSNSVSIGGAQITSELLTINLPAGTTVGNTLIIDPNRKYFNTIKANGTNTITALGNNSIANFVDGVGIDVTINGSNDIVVTNSGVTGLLEGTGIALSSGVGNVTITNDGVTSLTDGLGIGVDTNNGDITIVNEGIVSIEAGAGIIVGAKDPSTGKVIITNSAPAGNAYRSFVVAGEVQLIAGSSAATVTLIEGAGVNISTAQSSGSFTDRITFANTGVLSVIAGAGINVSAATGNVTLSFNNEVDIVGSVFSDGSTMLVDGTEGKIVGNVENSITRSGSFSSKSDVPIAVITTDNSVYSSNNGVQITPAGTNSTIQLIATTTTIQQSGSFSDPYIQFSGGVLQANAGAKFGGVFDGELTGSVFADNSTMIIDGTEGKVVGPVDTTYVKASSYIQTGVYANLAAIAAAYPIATKGMIVFDDDTNQFRGYDGSSWVALN